MSNEGFPIHDTGPRLRRLQRMTLGGWRIVSAILKAKPQIAHFHDPELIPWGILLRLYGIKVIYDVHEDYPHAVSQNFSLPALARALLPPIVKAAEFAASRLFDGIVTVTPQIASRFPKDVTVLVRNWPKLSEFCSISCQPMKDRPPEVAYIGTITANRNIFGMLEALARSYNSNTVLRLAGHFPVASDEQLARDHQAWKNVRFDGWLSRDQVTSTLSNVRAGLVIIKPVEHEMLTYPIKLFEYMAAGLPVIASNFPVWREIIQDAGCGVLVDPTDPTDIARAIDWIIDNPNEAERMGENGRRAILTKYNWESEVGALYKLYDRLRTMHVDGRID